MRCEPGSLDRPHPGLAMRVTVRPCVERAPGRLLLCSARRTRRSRHRPRRHLCRGSDGSRGRIESVKRRLTAILPRSSKGRLDRCLTATLPIPDSILTVLPEAGSRRTSERGVIPCDNLKAVRGRLTARRVSRMSALTELTSQGSAGFPERRACLVDRPGAELRQLVQTRPPADLIERSG
jgi:hypothetical protein